MRTVILALIPVMLAPPAANAQTRPCVGCVIAHHESSEQVRANQQAVQNMLQTSMNNQLQARSNALQTHELLRSLQLSQQMNASLLDQQRILLEQQMLIQQIRARESVKRPKPPVDKS
jgi:hypothetical protein